MRKEWFWLIGWILIIFGLMMIAAHAQNPVNLEWDPNSEPDLAGYNIYRSNQSGSGYVRLNHSLIPGTTFSDTSVAYSTTYYYVATAVNDADLESGFSNEVPFTTEDPLPTICIGDANQDGTISISDVSRIYQHIHGISPLTGDALLAGDANQDGSISISDISRIYQHIHGISPLEECQ